MIKNMKLPQSNYQPDSDKSKKSRKSNGSGSFKKRADGTWEYQISYGYGLEGKMIRKSFYGKTQSECRDKQKEYDKNFEIPIEKVTTVGEWSVRWLELYKKGKCSLKMYDQYNHIIKEYINPNIGYLKLPSVKPAHIAEMMGKYRDKSESLVKKVILALRGIFETAIDNNFCVKNPAKNIKPEFRDKKEKEFFNDKEIEIIEKFCFMERSNISDALIVLLYTGLRREELLGLKWQDIDFENNTINIARTIIIERAKKIMKNTMKNETSKRIVPLLPKAREILETKQRTCEFVFPTKYGEYQRPDGFNTRFDLLIKRINRNNDSENQIRELSPHCCRHTFATHLSKNGVDIKIIQILLGHADISVTGIYTHPTIEGMKKALEGFKY